MIHTKTNKIFSMVLAVMMLVSCVPAVALATTDVGNGTVITLNGTGSEAYTITVPAELAAGESGTVTASGTWDKSKVLNVTAPNTVELSYGSQTMDVGVTFAGIELAGDPTETVTGSETVSIASASALFGTWEGLLEYNVELVKLETTGLYKTDGSFVPWSTLVSDGTVNVNEGVVTTNVDMENGANASAEALNGKLIIDESVTSLGDYAFAMCSNLTSVEIPNSVTSLGDYAFLMCSNLTSVDIPDSVTSIGMGAFAMCSNLTSINVDADNQNYCSLDGVLYNKNMTTLIQYPAAKTGSTFSIPDGVTNIGNGAFVMCSYLTSIDIPDSVTIIGESAFAMCSNLTSIDIPESVTSIGITAFNGCTGLNTINFAGTTTQWNAITLGDSWNMSVPATEVICSDGTVALS